MATLAFAASAKGDHGSHKAVFARAEFGFAGFKGVIGRLTLDTDYPDDGYTAAALEALAGLSPYISKILCIVPLGPAVAASGETGAPIGWDMSTRTLRVFQSAGDGDFLDEIPTGENDADGAVVDVLVIGS